MRALPNHFIGVTAIAQSPDGTRLASGDGDGRIWTWQLADMSGKTHRTTRPHASRVVQVAFLTDSRQLVSMDRDGRVVLWNAEGETLDPAIVLERGGGGIAPLAAGFVVAINAGRSSSFRVFDGKGQGLRDLKGSAGPIVEGMLASSGDRFAAVDRAGSLVV